MRLQNTSYPKIASFQRNEAIFKRPRAGGEIRTRDLFTPHLFLSQRSDSNRRPTVYETVALPAELRWHKRCGAGETATLPLSYSGIRTTLLPITCLSFLVAHSPLRLFPMAPMIREDNTNPLFLQSRAKKTACRFSLRFQTPQTESR